MDLESVKEGFVRVVRESASLVSEGKGDEGESLLGEHRRHEGFRPDSSLHRNPVEVNESRDSVRHDAAFLTLYRLLHPNLFSPISPILPRPQARRTFNGLPHPSKSRSSSFLSTLSSPSSPSFLHTLTLPTLRPSSWIPNKLSRNSRSPAIIWWIHASMSPMYRIGSCACSSMGRGSPEGPPRVRASRKRVKMEEERVEPRRLRISLGGLLVSRHRGGRGWDSREQFRTGLEA